MLYLCFMLFKEFIIWAIVIWIIYQILNKLILPIVRVSTFASGRIKEMEAKMREQEKQRNMQSDENAGRKKGRVKKEGDYIDFEELK